MFQWLMRAISGPSEPQGETSKGNGKTQEGWNSKPHNKKLKRMANKTRAEAIEECDRLSQERYDDIDEHIQKHRDLQMRIRTFKQKKSAVNS